MTSFKKMSLIAQEELDRLKQRQLTSYNPELRSMVFLKDEMDQLLLRTDLPAEEKLKLFQTAQHRFQALRPDVQSTTAGTTTSTPRAAAADEEEEASPIAEGELLAMGPSTGVPQSATFARVVTNLPKQYRSKGTQLVEFFDEHPGRFSATSTGEMAIDGKPIPNSNFNDLIRHLYIGHQQTPVGLEHFVSALRELNVPRTSISNRKVIDILNQGELFHSPTGSPTITQKGKGRGFPPGKRPRILYLYKQ